MFQCPPFLSTCAKRKKTADENFARPKYYIPRRIKKYTFKNPRERELCLGVCPTDTAQWYAHSWGPYSGILRWTDLCVCCQQYARRPTRPVHLIMMVGRRTGIVPYTLLLNTIMTLDDYTPASLLYRFAVSNLHFCALMCCVVLDCWALCIWKKERHRAVYKAYTFVFFFLTKNYFSTFCLVFLLQHFVFFFLLSSYLCICVLSTFPFYFLFSVAFLIFPIQNAHVSFRIYIHFSLFSLSVFFQLVSSADLPFRLKVRREFNHLCTDCRYIYTGSMLRRYTAIRATAGSLFRLQHKPNFFWFSPIKT